MSHLDYNRPLYTLTVGEYVQLHKALNDESQQKQSPKTGLVDDQVINSIKGLAKYLHCSVPTAQKFKNRNPDIFHQTGRIFIVSKTEILSKMK